MVHKKLRCNIIIYIFLILFVAPLGAAKADPALERYKKAWPRTNFNKKTVDFSEIISGGPQNDGIPAIDSPKFIEAKREKTLLNREPIIAVQIENDIRAYPIRYLMWHEIVNDVVSNRNVTITFCPLCNSALVFDGRLNGRVFTFGVSGLLRNADMIMYDRQTESWWQQFTGEAIAGEMTGTALTVIPTVMESWNAFKTAHPDGLVMMQPEGYSRRYGANPYVGYDGSAQPFLYRGEMPPHDIPPLARVVRVDMFAWPLSRLAEKGKITENGVTLTWRKGQASALDGMVIGQSRHVGDVRVVDAASGELVAHEVVFAFAFHAFTPDGVWMIGENEPLPQNVEAQ